MKIPFEFCIVWHSFAFVRLEGLECLFSTKLSYWWSMNPAAYVDVLLSLRKHRAASPGLQHVINELASKLLCHGPEAGSTLSHPRCLGDAQVS